MHGEIFTYDDMDKFIANGEAKILKKSQRVGGNNHYRYWVKYKGEEYLICNQCSKYYHIDLFTSSKYGFANKQPYCKQCRSKMLRKDYNNNFSTHMYLRYKRLEQTSKQYNIPYLSYNEFITFAKTVKEPIFELTLEGAFYKNMSNEFEIEHSHPISKGGNSLLNNLTLMHKSFNRFKGTMTLEDTLYFAKLIVKHEDKIRKSYYNKQI